MIIVTVARSASRVSASVFGYIELFTWTDCTARREDLASTFVRVYGVVASRSDKAGPRRRR